MDISDLHIDERSPVPLWYQLRNQMLSQIISDSWKAGSQLPTEEELCNTLNISRSTVRSAVESLVRDGLIVRTRGKGSFVATAPTTQIKFGPLGFHRTMTARGHSVRSKVLKAQVMRPTEGMMKDLNLHEDDEVLHIRRLRYLNDLPSVLSDNFLVYALCEGLEDQDLSTGSLWARLEDRLGCQVAGGIHTFHAVLADEEEQRLLNIAPDIPLLMSVGTNYLTDGTAFERSRVKAPGNRGFLEVRYVTRAVSSPDDWET
jgi:GntR family transcriptional regulator